jgi:hypothetical protein
MGNIFEKSEKPKKPKKKPSKQKLTKKPKKTSKQKLTKKQKGGNKNLTDAESLFELMKMHQDGWEVLSKQKPVATLESGVKDWFITPFYQLSQISKKIFLQLINANIIKKYGYSCRVQLYDIPNRPKNINRQFFFYIPEYFNIACELFGLSPEQGKEYVFNPFSSGDNKTLFINLVFGDYYKPWFTSDEKERLRPFIQEYNLRVGLPELNSHELERYTKIY